MLFQSGDCFFFAFALVALLALKGMYGEAE